MVEEPFLAVDDNLHAFAHGTKDSSICWTTAPLSGASHIDDIAATPHAPASTAT
jgi:hypothetical protein